MFKVWFFISGKCGFVTSMTVHNPHKWACENEKQELNCVVYKESSPLHLLGIIASGFNSQKSLFHTHNMFVSCF